MKKRIIITAFTVVVILMIIIGIIIIKANEVKDEWDINAKELVKTLSKIEKTEIEDLREYIPFEWDTIYSFSPYVSEEYIYNVVGYKWDEITSTISETANQIVFLKDGKVVCYLYGYPQDTKIYFDLGYAEKGSGYIKFTNEYKLPFKIDIKKKIPYFVYTGEDRINIIAVRGEVTNINIEEKTITVEGKKEYDTRYERVIVKIDENTDGNFNEKKSKFETFDITKMTIGTKVEVLLRDSFATRTPNEEGYYFGEGNIIETL